MEDLKLHNHISQRLLETWDIVKSLNDGMAKASQDDYTKVQVIKEMKKTNPDLKAEDVKNLLLEVQKANRDFHLRGQEVRQYQPIAQELNLLMTLFKIESPIPQEEKEIFEQFANTSSTVFQVEKGVVTGLKKEYAEHIDKQFEEQAGKPENLEMVLQQLLSRKDKD